MYDVIIIGAGASGLFCAHRIGREKKVLVLDHANKVGKKILMSGGGRCNFTNVTVTAEHFVGNNRSFVRSALARFGSDDFLAYVYKHNIAFHERVHGELFCDDSAKDIVAMLLSECKDAGVTIDLNTTVTAINQDNDGRFVLNTQHKTTQTTLVCNQLVVATGGLSIPTMGATGFGYAIAEQFGHSVTSTRPSLVPFTFSDHLKPWMAALAGISCEVQMFNDYASFTRPILFTHRGLSGPACLQLSNYWTVGSVVFINLLPQMVAAEWLLEQKIAQPKKRLRTLLEPFFAKKLLAALEALLWFDDQDKALADIKNERLILLGNTLNAWALKPSGTEGYRVAEVTYGGVDTSQISSKTMQSKLVPNLYFIGEVLDVTGHLGGYNFQWAWASAAACADDVRRA